MVSNNISLRSKTIDMGGLYSIVIACFVVFVFRFPSYGVLTFNPIAVSDLLLSCCRLDSKYSVKALISTSGCKFKGIPDDLHPNVVSIGWPA